MIVTLPPNSLTEVTVEFERIFLKWNAYPPDANHGFYVGSAIVTVLEPKDLASNDCSNIR